MQQKLHFFVSFFGDTSETINFRLFFKERETSINKNFQPRGGGRAGGRTTTTNKKMKFGRTSCFSKIQFLLVQGESLFASDYKKFELFFVCIPCSLFGTAGTDWESWEGKGLRQPRLKFVFGQRSKNGWNVVEIECKVVIIFHGIFNQFYLCLFIWLIENFIHFWVRY